MFINRKTKAGKTPTYRMRMCFKTLVTYKKIFITSCQATVSVVKKLLSDITQTFLTDIFRCPVLIFRPALSISN